MDNKYKIIYQHYEKTLKTHGFNHKGMDWPKAEDLERRFKVMYDLMSRNFSDNEINLLDLGCGIGLYYDFLIENNKQHSIVYSGIDISTEMIKGAKELHPKTPFEVRDILLNPLDENSYDYIIMNGLMTEKVSLTQEEMLDFSYKIILNTFKAARVGIAFNVMSSHVDWKRDDLFHCEIDPLVDFLVKNCSRHIKINMDYGLYEYTVYLYKESNY